MALEVGTYVATLYGWEPETATFRRHARVNIERDGTSVSTVEFAFNGGAAGRVHQAAKPRPGQEVEDRVTQAMTMVVQDNLRRIFEDGLLPTGAVEISEDDVQAAVKYAKVDRDLDSELTLGEGGSLFSYEAKRP